jgi:toxin ParE1/3/4
MAHRVVYLPEAEADLDALYSRIAAAAGTRIAGDFVDAIISFIEALETFPERGTVRESDIPDLRIVGYRRSVSIAFSVRGEDVVVLGVFRRGQNISDDILAGRLP